MQPSDPSPLADGFGYSAVISGDNIILGAPLATPNLSALAAGAVYCFHRTNSTWRQEAKLERSLTVVDQLDYYGVDVVADGYAIMIRASGSTEGAVSLYI